MYTGHVAIALAVRGVRHDLRLWVLVLAAQGCDWVELVIHPFARGAPADFYSHAFPFVAVAAAIAATVVWAWKRSVAAAATVLALYLSHPFADYITSTKALWLGGGKVGLGLIGQPTADFAVQTAVCAIGFAVYWRSLPPATRRRISAALPLVVLIVLQGASDLRLEWVKLQRERIHDASVPTEPHEAGAIAPR